MQSRLMTPVIDFLNTFCGFILLNLVFVLTCLPVVTIGCSLTALYTVTMREARGEYGYLTRTYLQEWKKNLKTGTQAFGLLLPAGLVLFFNLFFWNALASTVSAVIAGVLALACLLWYLTFTYAFPLLARFNDTPVRSIRNAMLLALSHARVSFLLLMIDLLVACFCYFLPAARILLVLIGFAFCAYCKSLLLNKVFAEYEKENPEK